MRAAEDQTFRKFSLLPLSQRCDAVSDRSSRESPRVPYQMPSNKRSRRYTASASMQMCSSLDRDKSGSKEEHCRKPEPSCTQLHHHRACLGVDMMRRGDEPVHRS